MPEKNADAKPFDVTLTCSNGTIVLKCHPEWAPLGAARFRELVETGYFDGARFFRVVPNFVVQFGIASDPEVSATWRTSDIKDDPVKTSNKRGTAVMMVGRNSAISADKRSAPREYTTSMPSEGRRKQPTVCS